LARACADSPPLSGYLMTRLYGKDAAKSLDRDVT
jgi:hypothetical protein